MAHGGDSVDDCVGDDNVDDYVDYQTVVLCDGCGGMVNVSSYCINCPGNLCDTCKANHPNCNLTRNHRVLPRNHPAAVKVKRSISLPCKLHPENEYVTYCKKCHIPCCLTCMTQKHDGHSFCELEEIGEESRTEVAKFIQILEHNLLPVTEKARRKIRGKKEENESQKKEHEDTVKQAVGSLRKQLDKIESDSLAHIQHLYSKRDVEITSHYSVVEESRKAVKDTIANFKARLRECSNIEAVVLRSESPTLESFQLPDIAFSSLPQMRHSSYKLPSFAEVVGEIIQTKEKEVIHCNSPREYVNKAARKIAEAGKEQNKEKLPPPHFQESMIDVKIKHVFGTDVVPYSMVHTSGNEIWMTGGSTLIKQDNKGTLLTKLGVPFAVTDMTLSPSQNIIATDTGNKWISKISPTGESTFLLRTAPLSPRGICINDRHQLVVGLGYREQRPIKLAVYDLKNGVIVQEIEKDDKGNPVFQYDIYKVQQNGNGDYVIADTSEFFPKDFFYLFKSGDKVIVVNKEGRRRWVYDVHVVSDVACDMYHNVIFCDNSKSEICLLDSEGRMIRTLLTTNDGLCNPLSVSIDSDGVLCVAQGDRKVREVRYLKDRV